MSYRASVLVTMSRSLTPEYRRVQGDEHLILLGVADGSVHEDQATVVDLTVAEAREVARRITVACNLADADAQQLGIVR